MAGIDDFIKTNPQFKGEDPAEVAEYVFSTQFQGKNVERSEFDEYFLGKQQGWIGKSYDAVKGAIVGDAEFPEMGNLQTIGAGNSMGVGMASIFGSDEDVARAAVENNPGSALSKDANGNPILTTAEGQQAYITRPGWDPEDVTRIGGKILTVVGGGITAGLAGGALRHAAVKKGVPLAGSIGKGVIGRSTAAGTGAAGGDALMQRLAGRDKVDKGQVAVAGAIGVGAGAVGPALGGAYQWAKKKLGLDQWSKLTNEQQKAVIVDKLKKDGFTNESIQGLPDKWEFGLKRLDDGDLVSPDARIADAEFGYKVTKGQAMPKGTLDEQTARFQQLSHEEFLRQTTAGQSLRNIQDNIVKQTDENISNLLDRASGGAKQGQTRVDSAQIVQDSLARVEGSLKKKVDKAYEKARNFDLDFNQDWTENVAEAVTNRLLAGKVLIPKSAKVAREALKDLRKIDGTSLEVIDDQRKIISQFYDHAATRGERRLIGKIKDAFDAEISDAVDARLFTGDVRAVEALKKARGLFQNYAKQFRDDSKIGKKVQNILDMDADPSEVANLFFGVSGISKGGTAKLVTKYRDIVGDDSEAFNALRETYLHTILKNPATDARGAQAMVSQLKKSLYGDGTAVAKILFKQGDLARLRRFSNALETVLPDPNFRNSSGTTERGIRAIESAAWFNAPGIKMITGTLMDLFKRANANQVSKMPKVSAPALTAETAAVGEAYNAN